MRGGGMKEARRSFLKKRTKKLLVLGDGGRHARGPGAKVFLLLFFQKKKILTSSFILGWCAP
jgi:hypothetical protein